MIFTPRSPGLVGTISDGGIDTVSGLGLTTDTGNRVSTTFGELVLFNWTNRAQNTNHPLVTPAFTVSFSYKYKAPQGSIQNVLVHQGGYNPGGKGWNLSVYSGNVYITFGGVADYIICSIATAGFAVDGVYRITLTVSGNGGTARLYVNGIQKGSVTVGTMLTPAHHSTTIGCGYSGSSSSYTYYVASGVGIGELFLYSRELTAQEALDDYNSKDALPVNGDATGGVGAGAGSGSGGDASGTTGVVNGDASGGTGAGSGSGSGGDASGQSIIIRDDYERSSVNVSLSGITGSGDSAVITIKPRYQESEIVSGNRWWEISARIDGVLGARPTLTVLDYQSGKLFGHPWTSSHRCHFSYDRETWYPFDTQTLDNVGYTATFRHNTPFAANTIYFSNSPQFSVHQIGDWIASLDATYSAVAPTASAQSFTPTSAVSDYAAQAFIADEFSTQTDELSRTIPKTPLYAFEINDTSLMPADGSEKRVAILTGGVHAAEDIANHCLKAFIDALLGSSAQAQNLRRRYRILVYPLINAPGRAGGGWRGSFTQGYSGYDDANRHFTSELSQLEIVNKPKAAITTDRAGAVPDWAIDFHSQADNTWAIYVPGSVEAVYYTRQQTNAGVTITDMGGDWATAMNSVDTYFHGLGAKLSITSELGDATYVSMSGIASYNAAIVATLSSMLDDGYLISDAVATGGVGVGAGSGSGGSAGGEFSAVASGGTGSGSSAGSGGNAIGEAGGSATATGGTGTGAGAGSGGSASGQASAEASGGTGSGSGSGSGGSAAGVVQGIEPWPAESDVRLGVTYGPTGTEYTGTMAGVGGTYSTEESIAAAVVSALAPSFAAVPPAVWNEPL